MLLNIFIAIILIIICISIHAGAMMLIIGRFRKRGGIENIRSQIKRRVWPVCTTIVTMFLASICEVLVWAYTYLLTNSIEGFEKAFYFSMVTYTTLGYGDITLQNRWRLLAGFEAATGIILFGWTTAIVIAIVQKVYFSKTD